MKNYKIEVYNQDGDCIGLLCNMKTGNVKYFKTVKRADIMCKQLSKRFKGEFKVVDWGDESE